MEVSWVVVKPLLYTIVSLWDKIQILSFQTTATVVAEATVVVIAMGEAEATAATVEAEATGMGKKKDVPRLLELPSTTDISVTVTPSG